MKKFVLFSLFFLSLNGLYVMGGGGTSRALQYRDLPQEMDCEVMRYVPQNSVPIAPEDAVQDVAGYEHDGGSVQSVAWSPVYLATAGEDNGATDEIQIFSFDPVAGLLTRLTGASQGTGGESVALSPDGTRIASGGGDRRVKIANRATGEVQTEYRHEGCVRVVAWSPDGTRIASGDDSRVKIKSVVPLLLATHKLEHPTLSQYLLLKGLQDSLLKNKKLLIVGESGKGTLEEMPELKKLLSITPSKPGAQHLAWRLQLKRLGTQFGAYS